MNFSIHCVHKKSLQYELAQRLIWAGDGILRLLRADNIDVTPPINECTDRYLRS